MFDHHACLYTDKLDACTACTIHALPHEIKGSHREILGRSLLVIYKRFSALLHIDNIQCLLCYPAVQTVIPAMYLTSVSCPTAVRSARRKLMVRTVHIFLEEAEQSGYLFPVIIKDIVAENKKVEYHAAIAVQQHDLVVDQFGATTISPRPDMETWVAKWPEGAFMERFSPEKRTYGYAQTPAHSLR